MFGIKTKREWDSEENALEQRNDNNNKKQHIQFQQQQRQQRTAASCQRITNVENFVLVILCVKLSLVIRQAFVTSGFIIQFSDSVCAFTIIAQHSLIINFETKSTILSRTREFSEINLYFT